ncbi:MAG: general secretion pathway protein GspM [Comamonadaceae bacterium]|nr:general secretion pathway protein GspM [Comamonadaceae bacterium]
MASPSTPPLPLSARLTNSVQTALERLSPRERNAVMATAWIAGLFLLWWVALAPAIQTLRQAPSQHAQVDAQLASLRAMASTAEAVRAQNTAQPLGRTEALRALEESMGTLGQTGQLNVVGDRPTVTLRGTTPEALATWLARVRLNARLTPVEAQLSGDTTPVSWSGSVVLAGPPLGEGN